MLILMYRTMLILITLKPIQQTAPATKYVNQIAGAQVNLLSKKGWFLQNDVSGNTYSGLSDGFNQSFWLWNAAIGKKILKKQAGELKLSVFDLLKQNQSIVRTVTDRILKMYKHRYCNNILCLRLPTTLKILVLQQQGKIIAEDLTGEEWVADLARRRWWCPNF